MRPGSLGKVHSRESAIPTLEALKEMGANGFQQVSKLETALLNGAQKKLAATCFVLRQVEESF
jgi:histidine ammonia-lyase